MFTADWPVCGMRDIRKLVVSKSQQICINSKPGKLVLFENVNFGEVSKVVRRFLVIYQF